MAGGIVCGVDDLSDARRAVGVAVELAADLSKPLLLVHVTKGDPSFPYGDRAGRERRRHAVWRIARSAFAVLRRDECLPTDAQERIETGDPAMELAALARKERAAFIVVASRGRGEIASALRGSVSDSLERVAPCPLVVVPRRAQRARPRTARRASIVCGIADPQTETGLVKLAADLAGVVSARLEVVHADSEHGLDGPGPATPTAGVWPPEPDPYGQRPLARLEAAMHLAEAHGVPAGGRLAVGPAALALDRVARREDARLIVIGSRRGGRLRSLVRGSISRQLAQVGTTPVVIVPQHADGYVDRRSPPSDDVHDEKIESHSEPYSAALR